ncbi:hypothetical protein METHPM2_1090021 [Pseudomonas sp. PM2]
MNQCLIGFCAKPPARPVCNTPRISTKSSSGQFPTVSSKSSCRTNKKISRARGLLEARMSIELEKLPPKTRQAVEGLMRQNGWSFAQAINAMMETSIASGALSEVGRKKAKVLQLVTPMRASGRDS